MVSIGGEPTITISLLIQMAIILMGIWGFVKVVREIVKSITERHDREEKWDNYEKNLKEERDKIYEKYDTRLEEMEKEILDNHTDTEAKMQQIRAELQIQSETLLAVLDGLQQLNCNGAVSDAKKALVKHLSDKAYE